MTKSNNSAVLTARRLRNSTSPSDLSRSSLAIVCSLRNCMISTASAELLKKIWMWLAVSRVTWDSRTSRFRGRTAISRLRLMLYSITATCWSDRIKTWRPSYSASSKQMSRSVRPSIAETGSSSWDTRVTLRCNSRTRCWKVLLPANATTDPHPAQRLCFFEKVS